MFKVSDVVVLRNVLYNKNNGILKHHMNKPLIVEESDIDYIKIQDVEGAGWMNSRFELYKPKDIFEGIDFSV